MFSSETSEIARAVDRAMLLIGGTSLLLLLAITAVMVFFVVRFRRSRSTVTSQNDGHLWLEITWSVVPTIIVGWMFFVAYDGFALMRAEPENPLIVEVTGQRWVWSFHYAEEKVDTTELVVPVGRAVKLKLQAPAGDVLHSFFLPEFRVKEDVVPGKKSWMWFLPEEEGESHIFCAEFCGKDHSKMISRLRVVSEQAYEDWILERKAEQNRPVQLEDVVPPVADAEDWRSEAALLAKAEPLYKTFCVSCHGPAGDGSGMPGVARNFTQAEGWKRSPAEVDVFRTLHAGVPGTPMAAYPNLSSWQKIALAKYVQGFAPQKPEDTSEAWAALIKELSLDQVAPVQKTLPLERAMELVAAESKP
ncbi:MAG: cytochrome c oxidase subunit II [Deltaproteobacteria bacterium]|nr:cytochrome c oxidase subunit II [Deltaproteobacteria bacterium]